MYNEGDQHEVPEGIETTPTSTPPQKDEHVKHVLYLAIVFVALLIVTSMLGYSLYRTETQQPSQIPEPESVVVETTEVCNYANDGEAYAEAITKNDWYACGCIQDESKREVCNTAVKDGSLFNDAVNYMNPELCDEISAEELIETCRSIVASGVEYFTDENPQYLADLRITGRNEDSISSYENLLVTDPNNTKNLATLALLYAEKGLQEQAQGRDQGPYVEKALATIEKAKELDANNSDIYRIEAYIYEVKPDLEKAMHLYTRAIELEPRNALAYAGRGHAEKMQGLLELALEDYRKAAELDVNNVHLNIYTSLCNLEVSFGRGEDAEAHCLIAVESEEGDVQFRSEAYQMLSVFALSRKDFILANSYLSKAQTLTPRDPGLYEEWSRLKIYEADYTTSEMHARKAVSLAPAKATAHLSLSHALYMLEEHEASIQSALEGLDFVETDVSLLAPVKPSVKTDLYYSIANNYRELGNIEKQEEYIRMAEALQNTETVN